MLERTPFESLCVKQERSSTGLNFSSLKLMARPLVARLVAQLVGALLVVPLGAQVARPEGQQTAATLLAAAQRAAVLEAIAVVGRCFKRPKMDRSPVLWSSSIITVPVTLNWSMCLRIGMVTLTPTLSNSRSISIRLAYTRSTPECEVPAVHRIPSSLKSTTATVTSGIYPKTIPSPKI